MFSLGPNRTDNINNCVYCPWNFLLLFCNFCRYLYNALKPEGHMACKFLFWIILNNITRFGFKKEVGIQSTQEHHTGKILLSVSFYIFSCM